MTILQRMQLIDELWQAADKNTILGIAILNAIGDKQMPDSKIIQFVKDQAKDSFKTMSTAIGERLTTKILNS